MSIFSNIFGRKEPKTQVRVDESVGALAAILVQSTGGKVVSVSPKTAVAIGVVFECIDRITSTFSLITPKIISNRNGIKNIEYSDANYSLITRQPYTLYSASTFYSRLITHYLLYGNAYAEIIRQGAKITGFRIIEPSYVDVEIIDYDGIEEHVYKVYQDRQKRRSKIVLQRDMLHFMDFSIDGIRGLSRIYLKKDSLKSVGSTMNYSLQMYENGANINGLIYGDRLIEKEALKYFEDKVNEQWSSKNGGFKTLPPGYKFQELKYNLSFADAQIIEANKWGVEDVARIFNVPLTLLQRGESADNKNERDYNNFLTICIAPLALLIENELNRKLYSENPEKYVKFELKGLYRVDMLTRMQAHQIALNIGMMNKDEVRAIEDMNPIPDGLGETFYQQLNTIPLDKAEAYFDSIINNGQSKEVNNDNTGV